MEHVLNRDKDEKTDVNNPIKSIYVPPYGLQGQDFSCHITWYPSYSLESMKIELEKGLSFKHMFNVESEGVSSNKDQIINIDRVIENGYVGYVISSDYLNESTEILRINLEAVFVKEEKRISTYNEFSLSLFRPELAIINVPSKIKVKLPLDGLVPIVDEETKIQLVNRGGGVALLFVYPEEGGVQFTNFIETDNVKIIDGLKKRFLEVQQDYPEEEETLELIIKWFSQWVMIENNEFVDLDDFSESGQALREVLQKKENTARPFLDEVNETVEDTFRSAINYDKSLSDLLRSVEDLKNGGILLLNSTSAIEIQGKATEVSMVLDYWDARSHRYPKLTTGKFTIEPDSNATFKIPIYQLFGNGGGHNERR